MTLPSYARATASSALKASQASPSKTKDPETPISTPKKLKRPSTLTPQKRQSINYNADLYPIKPQDPSKPCPLATLPSELRISIYQYILEPHLALLHPRFIRRPGTRQIRHILPGILQISQAIRIEAAYVYYTSTHFTFTVRNLDFSQVILWLDHISPQHRALLTRNQHLSIRVIPGVQQGHSYPPQGWLLDAWMGQHWKDCSPYGNVYTIPSARHQVHFILFCRLLGWFQLNSTMLYRGVTWKYVFDTFVQSPWDRYSKAETLFNFLRDQVGVLGMGCVARAWTRGRVGAKGKEKAHVFLEDLDRIFCRVCLNERESLAEDWAWEMRRLRKVVETW
jgi:hypothetical protein